MSLVEGVERYIHSYSGLPYQHVQQPCIVTQAIRREHFQCLVAVRWGEPDYSISRQLALHSILFRFVPAPLNQLHHDLSGHYQLFILV